MSVTVLASGRPAGRPGTGKPATARADGAGRAAQPDPARAAQPDPARGDLSPSGVRPALPVLPPLRAFLPGGGLRRGSVVAVHAGAGATSLLLALMAGASSAGAWCAAVGMPALGPLAAGELGVAADRLVMVPEPGHRWASVVAGLLEGFDVVALRQDGRVRPHDARRLVGRARERGAVLLVAGRWEGAELRVSTTGADWQGLGRGHGRLRARLLTVRVEGRGAAGRPREGRLWLPGADGGCAVADDRVVTALPLPGGAVGGTVGGAGGGTGGGTVGGAVGGAGGSG